MENLRYLLYPYEASWPVFVAHRDSVVRKLRESKKKNSSENHYPWIIE